MRQLLALAPPEQQPGALSYAIEIERVECEAIRAALKAWYNTTQRAYHCGILHGGEEMARTLRPTDPLPPQAELTKH